MIAQYRFRTGIMIFVCVFITLISTPALSGEDVYQDTEISIEEAILRALENNQAFKIERLKPEIERTKSCKDTAAVCRERLKQLYRRVAGQLPRANTETSATSQPRASAVGEGRGSRPVNRRGSSNCFRSQPTARKGSTAERPRTIS